MSDRLKSMNHMSNEDIIDDLTKDLATSLETRENPCPNIIDDINGTEKNTESISKPDIPQTNHHNNTDIKYDEFDNDSKPSDDSDTESIDEEHLKDSEIDLTDEEKLDRKSKAEEFKLVGNDAFKIGDYELSIEKYTAGLTICPLIFPRQRSILYCNRSASNMKLQKYGKAIKDCAKAIELDDTYIKAYLRRAQSYEATEKYDESLADFKKVLELDPSNKESLKAVDRLPKLIEHKNEQLKTEMLGKLKDLGNMILKPFGISTDNFQMEQDPETKGYKINFKQ